jgi:chemotaxis response regulator CheB
MARVLVVDDAAFMRKMVCDALIKLGAKDFVVKPFQPARVIEAVGKALA